MAPGNIRLPLGNQEIVFLAPNVYAGHLDRKGFEVIGASQVLFLEYSLVDICMTSNKVSFMYITFSISYRKESAPPMKIM